MRDEHPLPGTDHVVDGVRLHVVHHGAGDGLPVLLLHGVPTWSYLWRDVQRDLGHRHATYAVDLLGAGRSERDPAARYDLASQAELLLRLLDVLGHERVAVVGHDVGGGVAVHLAARAPERVAALVLIDSPVHADAWPVPAVAALRARGVGDLQGRLLLLSRTAARGYLGMQLRRGLKAATMSAKVLDEYASPLLSKDGVGGLLRLVRGFDPSSVEQAFRLVAKESPPALVLWGDSDSWFSPAYGRRVAGDLPGASFVCIVDAGHFLPEDRPERVAEEIEAFLAEPGA